MATLRVCSICDTVAPTSPCPTCRAARERARRQRRGSTTQRGYGAEHQRDRRRLVAQPDKPPCVLCGHPILPGQAVDRHHIIATTQGGQDGPGALTHAHCNRSHGDGTPPRGGGVEKYTPPHG